MASAVGGCKPCPSALPACLALSHLLRRRTTRIQHWSAVIMGTSAASCMQPSMPPRKRQPTAMMAQMQACWVACALAASCWRSCWEQAHEEDSRIG